MPDVKLPLSKGLGQNRIEADWVDTLPLNMLAVSKQVLDATGYLRSWNGLIPDVVSSDIETTDLCHSGIYNTETTTTFRINGNKLQEYITDNSLNPPVTTVTTRGDPIPDFDLKDNINRHVPIDFSFDTVGYVVQTSKEMGDEIVKDGILYFYNFKSKRTFQLSNWAVGDRDRIGQNLYTVNFNGDRQVRVSIFRKKTSNTNVVGTISFSLSITKLETDITIIRWIFSNQAKGIYIQAVMTDSVLTNQVFRLDKEGEAVSIHTLTATDINKLILISTSYDFSSTEIRQSYIGGFRGLFNDTVGQQNFVGELRHFVINADYIIINRLYEMYILEPRSEVPTRTVIPNEVQRFSEGFIIEKTTSTSPNWIFTRLSLMQGKSKASFSNFSNIIDVVHNRARYIFIREGSRNFGITDIFDNTKIDYYAPFVDSNPHYGFPVACEQWRNFVVIFSKHNTTYFRLTGNTGIPTPLPLPIPVGSPTSRVNPIYQIEASFTTQCGAIHKGAVCRYHDDFAVVGSPVNEPISVYRLTHGQYQEIASRLIQQILRPKTESELAQIYIEPFKFDDHDGLLIHLDSDDNRTLVFNPIVQGIEWQVLYTNPAEKIPYRGIYHVYSENRHEWTCGDKLESVTSILTFNSCNQLGQSLYHELYTPLVQVRNKKLFDFEIDQVRGMNTNMENIEIAITFDGDTYQPSDAVISIDPTDQTRRLLLRNIGYSRNNNIGFRLSWSSDTPTSISNFRIRVEE